MWQQKHRKGQSCQVERIPNLSLAHLNHSQRPDRQHKKPNPLTHRCSSQTLHRNPYLKFPPPPNYPPPDPSLQPPMMSEEHLQAVPGPSARRTPQEHAWEMPNDYSYAYYEPGPPTRHTNVPHKGVYKEGSYTTHHTYVTRYGTEENIYEEISDMAKARLLAPIHQRQESMASINQSLLEEEVRRVQSGHRRVLGELNLAVEAMLMPSNSREGSDDTDRENDDQLADLLTVGPTDDLLSPVAMLDLDSGFSGSSSGASYRSVGGSLRRGFNRPKSSTACVARSSTPVEGNGGGGHKGFWGKKAWKKITSFPSNISLNKQKDEPRMQSGLWEDTSCDKRIPLTHTGHGHNFQRNLSQRSSEESWCSGSDHEISSDEESDRNRNNGQLRNTFNKALTLCDKLRGGSSNGHRLSLDGTLPVDPNNQGRLSRWFSIRRGSCHQYDIENAEIPTIPKSPQTRHKMPLLPEVEEESCFPNCTTQQRRQQPPSLPSPPPHLSPQQIKRRMIVAAIVHSENSYVATLQRLVNDYKKPLEESNPPILSNSKISTLFYRLSEILQCHTLFRIALAECIKNWDAEEKIGDVFIASFSKAIVLDIYSGFINNFSIAMDLAKMEAKRKSALADFLKVKQISSQDRLSFFGLMVKPVQRFPQFILFLQDLLKHTPKGHHDRMSLQLALTQLESLAEMLNERKRESEQYQAFKEMLRNISGKFSARPLSDGNRYLLREDNITQIEYNQNGSIVKAKSRRLLLLNDLVVCVSVSPKVSDDFGSSERLSLKWTCPVSDIEVIDSGTSPTLSRVLAGGLNKGGSLKSNNSYDGSQPQDVTSLCSEMSNLMHDYEIMRRVADLVGTLKGSYPNMNVENARRILNNIQNSIQEKDEEIAWMDSCCLQLVVRTKGKEEKLTFQTDNSSIKSDWITELRLAQLALDANNSPAWEIPEQEHRPSTKMPLFVRSHCIYRSQHQTEVRCGCYFTLNLPKTTKRRHNQSYLWTSTWNGASSLITIMAQHQQHTGTFKEIASFPLTETEVVSMEFVKGNHSQQCDTVWIGTKSRRIILYSADDAERLEEIGSTTVLDGVNEIKYHYDNVFVALNNGTLIIFVRDPSSLTWQLQNPQTLNLGTEPISSLLPINTNIYASCGNKVFVLNAISGEIQKNFHVHEHSGPINLMAHSGIGLWISLKHSSTVCLYHTETFKHLQDINIASNVTRVSNLNGRSQVYVTALLACKGLLWVGTNVGIILTIPLPRLEGVPIISGRVNISYHAHFGPISFLISLQPKNYSSQIKTIKELKKEESQNNELGDKNTDEKASERPKIEKQLSDTSDASSKFKYSNSTSPVVLRRRRSKESDVSRLSKTLPRSFGNVGSIFSTSSTSSQSSGDTCDVYGLYGELMYIKGYEEEENMLTDAIYESARRSDPELAAIPNKVSTLDRRLKMKVSRPRSLDLSNWSVDSKSSSIFTSSGSEESMAVKHGQSVSRNNSNASRHLDDVCEHNSVDEVRENENTERVSVVNQNTSSKICNNKGASLKTSSKNVVDSNTRKTVITIMGGRGYVNWRQPCCSADKSKNASIFRDTNSTDAHLVIWELKL
ncbi:rho guanine nucleotide exchange factor 10-like protein isoform X1 [Harmonia axyridis]|uniref:rho guanine nucleotide exchange factor 10-like protein isoform X1 n=1 Tax=Harmonia axyridis TaxID=115357 RepID=UPI001E279D54|nr:rho guanine nucleotide exchange factor 10-like protein isoform X1 [Harmonia axyridis]